ncbi:MAG TPA: hypothetical protein P5545_04195 [Bacteroidota bacterium]|nr:hypothetical protein [Bacteroidota bacterium]HRT68341.1 hypothetical protein [Bacteroidota bacterium]
MKRLVILAIFFAFSFVGYSQQQPQNLQQQQQETQILHPTVIVGDIAFIGQTLKTVEIKGSEVNAYLDVEKEITRILTELQQQKKKLSDSVQIDIPLNIAQNTLTFMDRATLTGQNAAIYKRFADALIASAKKK